MSFCSGKIRAGIYAATMLALMLFLFSAAGCVTNQAPIMVRQWDIEYPEPAPVQAKPVDAVLGVERFTASVSYTTTEMVYRPEDNQRGVYPYNRWRINPGDMTGDLIYRDIRASGVFKAVMPPETSRMARFRLQAGVLEFLEIDHPDGWEARMALVVTLLDTKRKRITDQVILQKEYRVKAKIADKGAEGLAKAMSRAMSDISSKLVKDLQQVMQKAL